MSLLVLLLLPLAHALSLTPSDLQALSLPPVLKEHSPAPRGWTPLGQPPSNYPIRLQIGLQQSNIDLLTSHLLSVSDPSHSRYGDHFTQSQVEDLVAPSNRTLELVHGWLRGHGVDPVRDNLGEANQRDWVMLELRWEKVEKMFGTEYRVWEHGESGTRIVRSEKWGVPEVLHDHVEVVQPTNKFISIKPFRAPNQILKSLDFAPSLPLHLTSGAGDLLSSIKGSTSSSSSDDLIIPDLSGNLHSVPLTQSSPQRISSPQRATTASTQSTSSKSATTSSCDDTMTAGCLRDLYGFNSYNVTKKSKSVLAIASYLNQYANFKDLEIFVKNQRKEAKGVTIAVRRINKGANNQSPEKAGAEANLDVQYGVGMAWPLPVMMYSTGGKAEEFQPDAAEPTNGNEPFLTAALYWLNLSDSNLPRVISTSYGDDEQTVPLSYANRVCNTYAQLGLRGVSMLFASGDGGVGGLAADDESMCISNDAEERKMFLPTFPSSCPWVTSVGSTVGTKEKATDRFASGAGWSNYFGQPSYQKNAISGYLNQTKLQDLHYGWWNASGRASPDVAASGDNFLIWKGGDPMIIGGTSASTPVFAAAIAVLNDYRFSKGQKSLGFLNPWIYSQGSKFLKDITRGSSFGCGTKGFPATPGWDAVTGFGTPNVGKMIKYLPK